MIGKQLLHYKIIEKLGAGGMGTVYLAEDTRLERQVALKFLSSSITENEEALERFSNEAKIAASLSHPNIAQVHAIEESDDGTFIVFQYIEGKELQNYIEEHELTEEQYFQFARSIADGLLAAHEEGIIHRDIKAGNIMISDKGRVKILDFGIAGLLEAADFHNTTEQIGTATYMAPELFVGLPATFQSEIWAYGVVLYQMFSKLLPFDGVYQQAISYSIMHEEPTPIEALVPEIPKAIASIISKCLQKDKDDRYQSFSEIIVELDEYKNETQTIIREVETDLSKKQKVTVVSIVGILSVAVLFMVVERVFFGGGIIERDTLAVQTASIAVLPFVDMSQEQDQEYFSDGLSEELLNVLTKVDGLKVAGRTSSFQFKGQNLDLREIGSDLGVDHVLEGSVRKFGNQIRITAQLVKADDGFHVWSETYQREYSANDLFQIQDEISQQVLQELEVRLLPEKEGQISKLLTSNTESYDLYLKATQLLSNRRANEIEEAIDLFDQAIEKDPEFAAAYARLAIAYDLLHTYGNINRQDMLDYMRRNIDRALLLDPELGWAYAALGIYHINIDNYEEAQIALHKAHTIIPGDPEIMIWYSNVASWDLYVQLINRAFETDPYNALAIDSKARWHYDADEFEVAFELMAKNLEINPENSLAMNLKAEFIKDQPFGRLDESFILAYQAYELEPGNLSYKFHLAEISFDLGFFFLVEQMKGEIANVYPENFSLLEMNFDYFLYKEQYDSARITLEKVVEFMDTDKTDYELFEPFMFMYLNAGWYNEAEEYLEENFPNIPSLENLNYYYLEDLALSSILYEKLGKDDKAGTLTQAVCDDIMSYLSYEGDIKKEIVQDLMDYMECVALQKNKDLVLEILEEIHFERGSKANIYTFLDANPVYEFLDDERDYRELRDRFEADIASMRNNAISWLQDQGKWQSEWEIFIPNY